MNFSSWPWYLRSLVLFVVSTFGSTLSLPCGFFSSWGTLEGINGLNFALEVNIGTVGKEARQRERGLGHCF